MSKLRIGIVGLGIMGKSAGNVLKRNPYVEIVAAADLNEKTRISVCDELGIPNRYESYEEMYEKAGLDAVSIATPDWAHHAPAVKALRKGIHVNVEKPLTTELEEAADIVNVVRETGLKLQVSYNHRWLSPYNATWKMIRAGEIGQPLMGYARKNNPIYVPTEMLSWSAKSSPAWFLSSHDIDLMCWWFDADPVQAHGYGMKRVLVQRGIDTYDMIQGQVKFSNGAFSTFEASWIYPNTHPAMPDSFMEVIGEKGHIHLDRKTEAIEMSTEERFKWPRTLLNFQVFDKWVGAFPSAVDSFVDAVREDREPYVTAYDGWRSTAVLWALHRAVISGKIEQVPSPPKWK